MVNQQTSKSTESTMALKNNIAVAYLRVSTVKQSEEGTSLDTQLQLAKKYARDNGLELEDRYIFQESRPASTINNEKYNEDSSLFRRPELNEILRLATKKKFHKLIVYSRDRLTRNVEEYFKLKHILKNCGIEVCYVKASDNIIPSNVSGIKADTIENLIEIILASVSELESNMIASRVRDGNKQCAIEGLWPGGKIPFGYMSDSLQLPNRKRKNSQLSAIPYEKEIVYEIFNYYTNYGIGYRKIADILNEKYPFKIWTKSSIESVLKNETYTGYVVWGRRGGRRNPGKFKDYNRSNYIPEMKVIDKKLWDQAIELKKKKQKINNPKYFHTPFLLKGKLFCGICNEEMNCKNYGVNKKSAYRCPTKKNNNISELIVDKRSVEDLFISQLIQIIESEDIDSMWLQYTKEKTIKELDLQNSLADYHNLINEIHEKLDAIDQVMNENMDYSLKLELEHLVSYLRKKLSSYEEIIESKRVLLGSFYKTKEDFQLGFRILLKNFTKLDMFNKRMIIDLIVEKVQIQPNKDNFSISITINPTR